jgi:outer membrane protein insertion porin family
MRVRRPRRGVVLLCSLVVSLLGASVAFAQESVDHYLGRPIASVRLQTEDRPELAPELVARVDLHKGEPLRRDAIRSSIAHLYSTGRFDDIVVLATDGPDGVEILLHLAPRHPVDMVRFEGDTGLPPNQLERLVKARYGGLPTNVRLTIVESDVKRLLAAEGYLKADVRADAEQTHNPDRATLVLHIQAGARARIGETTIVGSSPLSHDEIIEKTSTKTGTPYREGAIDAALAVVRDELSAKGYYEAQASFQADEAGDGTSVNLTLEINAGPHVALRWAGDAKPSGADEDYVPLRREGAADEDLLNDSEGRIRAALQRDGYWKATVTHARQVQGDELVITFTIARGPRFVIDHVEVSGHENLSRSTVDAQLGVANGDVFDQARVEAGARKVDLEYLRLGFYKATVDTQYEETPATTATEGHVIPRLTIVEGPRGTIAGVTILGAKLVPEADLRGLMRSKPGTPYVAANVIQDRDDLQTHYANLGFPTTNPTIRPEFSGDGRAVTLVVDVSEGPQIIVDDILVVGNRRVHESTIKAAMKLRVGEPLGEADRLESQRQVADLEGFRRVSITEEPRAPGETRARVIVTVDEAPATSIGYGGGLEAGRQTRTAANGTAETYLAVVPSGFFDIGRRNLFGTNRSVDLFSRLALRPRSAADDPTTHRFGFSEYRVAATYRERRAFHTDTDLIFAATLEQGVQTYFNYLRKDLTGELSHRITPRLSVSGKYTLDFTQLFDTQIPITQQPTIDRYFPQVRLSIFSTGVIWDSRNDPVAPSAGVLLSADGELAARAIGSQVGYEKTFLQASVFRTLTSTRRFVVAARAETGLARGFPRTVTVTGLDGQPTTQLIEDLPASQRFYAGGGTTVRGFEQDRLGVPAIINASGLSVGGNGLAVLNVELRTIVGKLFGHNLGIVEFVDAGNVFVKAGDVDLGQLRTAAGFGARYDSPLGPLRLDFGFKLNRRPGERSWEYHLSLGEAF